MNNIQLAHGSGGQAMQQLINSLFMEAFANPWLAEQEDQARLELAQLTAEGDRLAFSTDSYVIDPLFFPGGNIGKLAICGTANDVAVSGAIPRYLSCGFILEEGLPMETLKSVVNSMAATAREADIAIVTGDTKVVQRGAADKLFINTAGMGAIPADQRWLVTSEGAFSYLARDNDMKELYLWPINADQQGTPKQVRKVIDTIKKHHIPAIFSESTVSDKPARQVARESGAHYGGVLYVDSLSAADGPVPTYLDLLRVTTETIVNGINDGLRSQQ